MFHQTKTRILICYGILIATLVKGSWLDEHDVILENLQKAQQSTDDDVSVLTKQVLLQQYFTEQRVRTDGHSGIKMIRQRRGGLRNYFTETHSGYSAAAIHDHSNNIRTVGLGEFTAVLNGVEFKTRHNDYRLYRPHSTSQDYEAFEDIPFPEVPQAVLDKPTVEEQILEMREWFKAWSKEDPSIRPYQDHFSSVLCYLEGAWTTTDENIDEPFESDRHKLDASTWHSLHDKSRFAAYTGGKSVSENLAFLPTKIMDVVKDATTGKSVPKFAQWNYRIMCHKTNELVSQKSLSPSEDFATRMFGNLNSYKYRLSRAAHFHLNDDPSALNRPTADRDLLDKLMAQIPGKDNYQTDLTDSGIDEPAVNDDDVDTLKNVGFYHRWYKVKKKDAMGVSDMHRSFNDHPLFFAMTSNPKVAGLKYKKCSSCEEVEQRWTYAVPLEIIYLTPLHKWNPHQLKYHGDHVSNTGAVADGRWGDCDVTANKELNGTNSRHFYQTPDAFYRGFSDRDIGDTHASSRCVIDADGVSHRVRSSGTHIFLPNIQDVGILRTRYPIFPVHGEGQTVFKELNSLREVVLDLYEWRHMLPGTNFSKDISTMADVTFTMSESELDSVIPHVHSVVLTANQILSLKAGKDVEGVKSVETEGHVHELRIRWQKEEHYFYYVKCEDAWAMCWDKHPKRLHMVSPPV